MAKIKTRAFKSRSNAGATLIVRDRFAPIVTDEQSPFFGEYPPLRNADDAQVTITLLGPESDVARRFDAERRATVANRFNLASGKGGASLLLTPEQIAEQYAHDTARLVAMTVAWTGMTDAEGAPVEFSDEEARELYTEDVDIREQALQFIGDRTHFFARFSTPSAPSSSIISA